MQAARTIGRGRCSSRRPGMPLSPSLLLGLLLRFRCCCLLRFRLTGRRSLLLPAVLLLLLFPASVSIHGPGWDGMILYRMRRR